MGGGPALLLETQAMPNIIRKVGEPHSGRVCYASVDAYLTHHHATFDRKLLAAMFEEADFRREGSLAPRDLVATLTGRYPRRRFTQQWRELAALILGADAPPISAAELAKLENTAARGLKRTSPFDLAWAPVEELPPPPKHTLRSPPRRRAASPPPPEWEAVLARADAVHGADGPTPPGAGAGGAGRAAALARTCRGVKVCGGGGASAAAEAGINAAGLQPRATAGGGGPRCTFDAAAAYAAHSGGILLASQLRSEAAALGGARDQRAHAAAEPQQQAGARQPFGEWLRGPRPQQPRSASAPPPPRRASAPAVGAPSRGVQPSALQRLRNSVRAAGEDRPPFLTNFHPLLPGDEFYYLSLGQPLDLRGPSISRQ
ncbi:hypothetical protein Rsub_08025 [Raphidocelis subcapitata]|uniref:EF-hand domain-containing protein n=1 Tax=Raphidocelis subcapitata TaxID=307507 RepID=A0A2V0PAC1_9CHLO|nr:hypothetical protein Rsub_08025 [Raphidocelis subcapitata]|eukprot:GBF94853.1 hypothetical protein Rsub_08025 [Raphidocelis subcapitata]